MAFRISWEHARKGLGLDTTTKGNGLVDRTGSIVARCMQPSHSGIRPMIAFTLVEMDRRWLDLLASNCLRPMKRPQASISTRIAVNLYLDGTRGIAGVSESSVLTRSS